VWFACPRLRQHAFAGMEEKHGCVLLGTGEQEKWDSHKQKLRAGIAQL